MKAVKFLDCVLSMRYRHSTPLDNITLIPLDLNLDVIKDCFIYGIVVPRLTLNLPTTTIVAQPFLMFC
jgi:hypothetical protein